jgi:hypothetical protein
MTDKQTNANRHNAQLSTGPQTPDGKARSSMNAVRHGVLSKMLLLPGESAEDHDAFSANLVADLRPVGALEALLVDRAVTSAWRLRRLLAVEVGVFELQEHLVAANSAEQEARTWQAEARTFVEVEEIRPFPDLENPLSIRRVEKVTDALAHAAALANAKTAGERAKAETSAANAACPALGSAFMRAADTLHLLSRYERTIEGGLLRALAELRALRRGSLHPLADSDDAEDASGSKDDVAGPNSATG